MKKIALTIAVLVLSITCFGQSLFFDNLNNSTWRSDPSLNDSTIKKQDKIGLVKHMTSLDSLRFSVTLWTFKDGLLTIKHYNYRLRKDSLIAMYKYEMDSSKSILKILFNDSTSLEYKVGVVSTGNYVYLSRKQEEEKKAIKEHLDVAFSPGAILQRELFTEANVLIGRAYARHLLIGIEGVRIGLETNFKNGKAFTIAPKVGYEISYTVFSMRLSAIEYFQNGHAELRLLPELGISWAGFANLTYGYGFRIIKDDVTGLSKSRIALSFNINRKVMKEVF